MGEGPGGRTDGGAGGSDAKEVTGALTYVDRFQSEHLQDTVGGPLPGDDKYARRTRRLVAQLDTALGLEALAGARPLSEWMPDLWRFW